MIAKRNHWLSHSVFGLWIHGLPNVSCKCHIKHMPGSCHRVFLCLVWAVRYHYNISRNFTRWHDRTWHNKTHMIPWAQSEFDHKRIWGDCGMGYRYILLCNPVLYNNEWKNKLKPGKSVIALTEKKIFDLMRTYIICRYHIWSSSPEHPFPVLSDECGTTLSQHHPSSTLTVKVMDFYPLFCSTGESAAGSQVTGQPNVAGPGQPGEFCSNIR